MMEFQAAQEFELLYPGPQAAALDWLQDPANALSAVDFLEDVQVQAGGQEFSGELVIPAPLLGEVRLPFKSRVVQVPVGAELRPETLSERRGWAEVSGQAAAGEAGEAGTPLRLRFQFSAFLQLPPSQNRGGAAFEKMVRATAERTAERIVAALPKQLESNMQAHAQRSK